MQHYEMLFILPARKSQEELEQSIQSIFQIVEKAGGKVTKKEVFAKQRLSYPIKKEQQGVYILSEFDMEQAKLSGVDHDLRLLPDLLRHQIVKLQVKSPERLEEERQLKERIASRRVAQTEKARQEEVAKETQEALETQKKDEKKTEKVDIEELDKKLEEILDDPLLK